MSYVHPDALDATLNEIKEATILHILTTEPATFANISSYTLGNKTDPAFGANGAGDPNGRQFTVTAISDGNVTGTNSAAFWCLADVSGSRLLAAGSLSGSQVVTSGNVFTLASFVIRIPNPA
jgi:hypothetical protein